MPLGMNIPSIDQVRLALSDNTIKLIALQRATDLFQNQFGYELKGSGSTTPPDASNPSNLSLATQYQGYQADFKDNAGKFVDDILSSQNVPAWTSGDAKNDLLGWVSNVVDTSPVNQWKFGVFSKRYEPSDSANQSVVETNAIFLFVNESLTIQGVTATSKKVCYVGVYYNAVSSSTWAKHQLRLLAYSDASKTMDSGRPIEDDSILEGVLRTYAGSLFQNHYGYKWGTPPPDFDAPGSYIYQGTSALGYFEDGKGDSVDSFVQGTLFKGAVIPEWTKNVFFSSISSEIRGLVSQFDPVDNHAWVPINYDQPYYDSAGQGDSLVVNASIVYFKYSQTLQDGTVARISYIFWLGEVFTKPPAKQVVESDLVTTLYRNLNESFVSVPSDGLAPNKAGLIQLLSRCAFDKFSKTYNYAFQGSFTKPPNSNGDEVYGIVSFGEFAAVTDGDVANWTANGIFKAGSFSFFPRVPGFQSRLNNRVVYWLTQNTSDTRDNGWGTDTLSQCPAHPSDSSKQLQVDAVVLYANGSLTENGFTAKSNMLCYVGVYYVTSSTDDDSDV